MTSLKLTYFDFHGGRGEPARLALSIGRVPFEDNRIKIADWPRLKDKTPYGGLPILEVDGEILAQSNTINRYVAKLADLYPSDAWQAALCDETMDAVEDVVNAISATVFLPEEEKKARREALAGGQIPFYLSRLNHSLDIRGGSYFADGRLTIADLKVAMLLRQLRAGVLDHVPVDLPERIAPELVEHFERVMNNAAVAAYYAERGVSV